MFLAHLRDRLSIKGVRRVVMHEPLSNLRKIIFVQCAHGMPRSEVWRALSGRGIAARRLRQDLRRGERGHRSAQCRCGVLVDGLPQQSGRRRACGALSLGRARAEDRPAQRRLNTHDRRDAEIHRAAARLAEPRVHGERAQDLGRAEAPGDHAAAAVAWLFAGRLGGRLGNLRAPRRRTASGRPTAATPSPAAAAASRRKRRCGTWRGRSSSLVRNLDPSP